jgi:hypothetical protein
MIALAGCRQSSAPSPIDPPVSFPNGSLPYTLTVAPNEACLVGYGGTTTDPTRTPIYPSEMALEASLVVSGDRLSFAVPQHVSDTPVRTGVTMDISRVGNHISGTIGGGFSPMARTSLSLGIWRDQDSSSTNIPTTFVGTIAADRTLVGVFSGFVRLSYVPANLQVRCEAAQYRWTLTSRLP